MEKLHACVLRFKQASKQGSLKSTRFLQKNKVGYFSYGVVCNVLLKCYLRFPSRMSGHYSVSVLKADLQASVMAFFKSGHITENVTFSRQNTDSREGSLHDVNHVILRIYTGFYLQFSFISLIWFFISFI